jgi:hypothetical protein
MIVLKTVDNQRYAVGTLSAANAALCVDVSENPQYEAGVRAGQFSKSFHEVTDLATRLKLSANAKSLVDGNGIVRVADAMEVRH